MQLSKPIEKDSKDSDGNEGVLMVLPFYLVNTSASDFKALADLKESDVSMDTHK